MTPMMSPPTPIGARPVEAIGSVARRVPARAAPAATPRPAPPHAAADQCDLFRDGGSRQRGIETFRRCERRSDRASGHQNRGARQHRSQGPHINGTFHGGSPPETVVVSTKINLHCRGRFPKPPAPERVPESRRAFQMCIRSRCKPTGVARGCR